MTVESRDAIKSERDFKYTMRSARKRYRLDLKAKTTEPGFRAWARRTYNPPGCFGKLLKLVAAKRPRSR